MAGQQQQIIDTIFGMKRKLLRRDDCERDAPSMALGCADPLIADTEDTDSPFRQDLKRKARYARASDPDFLSDPRPYKKVRRRLWRRPRITRFD